MNPSIIVPNMDGVANLLAVLPELCLTALAVAIVLLDVIWHESRRRQLGYVAAFGLFAIAALTLLLTPSTTDSQFVFGGMIRDDLLSQLFRVIVIVGAAIACLISMDFQGIGRRGEFYAVLIIASVGGCFMSSAADLIMVFIALETTSISLYILAGMLRNNARASEAGMKYFLFGAFTSAIMLYGLSLLYGFTHQTNLYAIGAVLRTLFPAGQPINAGSALPVLMALVMIAVGFGFKISAVPFHFWTPDVYEGAPTPVTAFISVASKAASFALLTRFFVIAFQGDPTTHFWVQMLSVLAVVTMTTGNMLALVQRNIKRLLAYSSIAQAGYTLIGVVAIASQPGSVPGSGVAAVGFYMAMYTLTNLAAFAVIIVFTNATGSETIADFAGLSRRSPGLALALTVALLSLSGIPPAAGFIGKFFLFRAAVDSSLTWLAMVGVLNSIVALYYYLVIIKIMWVNRSDDENRTIAVSSPYRWAIGLSVFGVVALGVVAGPLFDWAARAAQGLFS